MNHSSDHRRQQRFETIAVGSRLRIGRIARVYAATEAEDLVQEILLQIWRGLPEYDERSSLQTWAYRVTLNTAISWQRRQRRVKRQPPERRVATETLTAQNGATDESELLDRFMQFLSDVDRAVLVMYLDDLSNQEIADAIGVSNGAIRTRISRIRDQLATWEPDHEKS